MGKPAPAAKIVELRHLLAERFPSASLPHPPTDTHAHTLPTHPGTTLKAFLKIGTFTELAAPASSGSALLLSSILHSSTPLEHPLALVDGRDTFDPAPFDNPTLARLLWVRCQNAGDALRATDLLLRDANLPLVTLDLHSTPPRELRAIPGSIWYRLQRLLEQNPVALLAITPFPCTPCAHTRLTLDHPLPLASLSQPRHLLAQQIPLSIARQRSHPLAATA